MSNIISRSPLALLSRELLFVAACLSSSSAVPAGENEPPSDGASAAPEEIRRTRPDLILHDPTGGKPRRWDDSDFFWLNEHVLVQPCGDGNLLAMWTGERFVPSARSKVFFSRSVDGGTSWTPARAIDEPRAAWQVPLVAPSGRIYLFYTYGAFSGGFPCRVSDDHGRSWSEKTDLEFARCKIDNPAPSARPAWISPTVPIWDDLGRPLIGYTLWATAKPYPRGVGGHSQIGFFRIENLAENPDPADLKIDWLHTDRPITVPHQTIPNASYAQEPYTVRLPDGRFFCVMRTNSGRIWYTVSADQGGTWRATEPLCFRDGGEPLLNPVSPCPVFSLDRGDFVLLFNNNDGRSAGHAGPEDRAARRPAFLCRGEFRPKAHQPVWFSRPKLLVDNDRVRWGPPGRGRLEAATYCSLTEHAGRRVLWYPDRKGFLLGKVVTDAWLSDMSVPK